MAKTQTKNAEGGIQVALEGLEKIVRWFETQEELDLEEGLKRIKEGAAIAKDLKTRLKSVENEFTELKKELE